jgi:hypothetical protein
VLSICRLGLRPSRLHLGLAYMADLDEEIAVTRSAYVGAAVTEIASLRAQLSGPQFG